MKMKTIGRLLVVAALAIAAAEVGAVCVDAAVRTGIFQEYPFADICDTPPPPGYGPFYISHYGRHGSRYLTKEANCLAADVLEHAAGKGALTDAGLELLGRLRRIKAVHSGMYGQLTTRGAEEHRRLAQRMHARFGGVFSNGGKVRCQSSTIPRCLASMANFACELKGLESNLGFDFATGDGYMAAINGLERIRNDTRTAIKKSDRKFMEDTADPALTIGRLFSDESAASRLVGDPYAFMTSLFYMIASCRPLAAELEGLEIFDMFPPEELLALEKAMNGRWYVRMANSAEFGDAVVASAETLAHDIAQRAEEAIRCGGIAADLRFGHDAGLWPLAGYLGIYGVGDRVPFAEVFDHDVIMQSMTMASNLQLVFYRNDKGDVIVKVLYNEGEVRLRGVMPVCGPYYSWHDMKARLMRRYADPH